MTEENRLIALFEKPTDTAETIDALIAAGLPDDHIDVITGVPYPEGSLGLHREWLRLPLIVLAGALGGLFFGLFLAVITPHLYRLDVGGHPTVSFAPAAVITFVFTMMATIISTFLGVLWEMNFPEFGPKYYHKSVTDGFLALLVTIPQHMEPDVHRMLEAHGGTQIHRPEKQLL
jgi:fatty acid desaturase